MYVYKCNVHIYIHLFTAVYRTIADSFITTFQHHLFLHVEGFSPPYAFLTHSPVLILTPLKDLFLTAEGFTGALFPLPFVNF